MVLCAASSYEQKYFLDPAFMDLPEQVQDELHSTCVLFAAKAGGIIIMEFDEEGQLLVSTQAKDSDIYYDEIGAGLMVRELLRDKEDLFRSLELYYKVFFGEGSYDDDPDMQDLYERLAEAEEDGEF